MEQAPLKSRLLAMLHTARAEQHAFVNGLSQDERDAASTSERWSGKDVVAHCTAWQERMLITITALTAGEQPPNFDDIDRLNDATFVEHQHQPWPELLTEAEMVFAKLIGCVRELDDSQLAAGSWRGLPLWRTLLGNSYWHPQAHIAEFLLKQRGDFEAALALQRAIAEGMGGFDGTRELRGVARYNLACFLAQAGRLDEALAELRAALDDKPDLAAWAREDNDLAALRGQPAYEALYEGL